MQWENYSTFVNIRTCPGKTEEVYENIKKDPNIIGAFLMPGHYDVFCWFNTRNMGDAYKWIKQVREWPQVDTTSCCPVYTGYWNEKPYQDFKYYAWMQIRACRTNQTQQTTPQKWPFEHVKNCKDVTFAASVPGDYDCYALYCANDYNTFYKQVKTLRDQGYDVQFWTPMQSFWNQQLGQVWTQYEKTAYQPNP